MPDCPGMQRLADTGEALRLSDALAMTQSLTRPSLRGAFPSPLIILATALIATVCSTYPARAGGYSVNTRLSNGMAEFVSDLDSDQRDLALYDFDDDERFDLRLAPFGLEGLTLSKMSEAQWAELEKLLGGVLSPDGLAKVNTIRSLEREVAATEGGLMGLFFDRIRDVRRYYLAVFGTPATDSPWGMRFDGHHLSLNWAAIPDAPLSATPLFFGGQPRKVPAELERAGLRVLAAEEDLAVALLNGLSGAERELARRPLQKGGLIQRPMSITPDVDLEVPTPEGLFRSTLAADSRARLDRLIEVHLSNFAPAIADRYRAQILNVPRGPAILFAAAGDRAEVGRALFYRIQGGGFVIEFDNTSDAADHIHVVFRNPVNDFGRDVLSEHHASHHASADAN